MHLRTTALVAAALLWGGAARGAEAAQEYKVDLFAQLDAHHVADLGGQVGPIVFHQIFVQNVPPPDELAGASPKDQARPKPVLLFDNVSTSSAKIDVKVQLEDEAGVVLLTCPLVTSEGQAWKVVADDICRHRESMATRDWLRVRGVRVVGTVVGRE